MISTETLIKTRDLYIERGHAAKPELSVDPRYSDTLCIYQAFDLVGGNPDESEELAHLMGFVDSSTDSYFTARCLLLDWHDGTATKEQVLARLNTAIAQRQLEEVQIDEDAKYQLV